MEYTNDFEYMPPLDISFTHNDTFWEVLKEQPLENLNIYSEEAEEKIEEQKPEEQKTEKQKTEEQKAEKQKTEETNNIEEETNNIEKETNNIEKETNNIEEEEKDVPDYLTATDPVSLLDKFESVVKETNETSKPQLPNHSCQETTTANTTSLQLQFEHSYAKTASSEESCSNNETISLNQCKNPAVLKNGVKDNLTKNKNCQKLPSKLDISTIKSPWAQRIIKRRLKMTQNIAINSEVLKENKVTINKVSNENLVTNNEVSNENIVTNNEVSNENIVTNNEISNENLVTNNEVQNMQEVKMEYRKKINLQEYRNRRNNDKETLQITKSKWNIEEEKDKLDASTCDMGIQRNEIDIELSKKLLLEEKEGEERENKENKEESTKNERQESCKRLSRSLSRSRSKSRSKRRRSRSKNKSLKRSRSKSRNRDSRKRSRSTSSSTSSRSTSSSTSRSRSRSRNSNKRRSRSRSRDRRRRRSNSRNRYQSRTGRRRSRNRSRNTNSRSISRNRSRSRPRRRTISHRRSSISSNSSSPLTTTPESYIRSGSSSRSSSSSSSKKNRLFNHQRSSDVERSYDRYDRCSTSNRYNHESYRRSPPFSTNYHNKRKQNEIDERRVIHIGDLDANATESNLYHIFRPFGRIERISIHFSNGNKYGFVTFSHQDEAFKVLDCRNHEPLCKYSIGIGGRREFCQSAYSDLDDTKQKEARRKGSSGFDFLEELKQLQADLRNKKNI